MDIAIIADPTTNPDLQGEAKPVTVMVFQLEHAGEFNSADFFTLASAKPGDLSGTLIRKERIQMTPGKVVRHSFEFDPEAHMVGVTAGFRELENASWRATAQLPDDDPEDHIVNISVLTSQIGVVVTPH